MIALALANQKGGVGKTTVTLGLAEAACSLGFRVLVIDCDPQANASAGLGVPASNEGLTLADLLEEDREITDKEYSEAIVRSPWSQILSSVNESGSDSYIDVMRSHPRLGSVETLLASDPIGASDRLSNIIAPVKNRYDIVLMDCPPSLGLLTVNALFAADDVVIVSAPSAWSSDGVDTFVRNVERIAQRRQGKPAISGILVNNVGRTRDGKFWESEIMQKYDMPITRIASRAAIAEFAAMSEPLLALGARPGALEAKENFREVFNILIGVKVEQENPRYRFSSRKIKSVASAI